MQLHTPVSALTRVGKTIEKRLKHLGIHTAEDLLWYFPFRYDDFTSATSIAEVQEGMQVSIRGKIELIANKRSPRKKTYITKAIVADDTEQMKVVWFGQPFLTKNLKVGDEVILSGKITDDMFGLVMKSPTYEKAGATETSTGDKIVPVYSLTMGMTQKQLRFLIKQVLPLTQKIHDWLPDELLKKAGVISLQEALLNIHFPKEKQAQESAEKRLKFDELFTLQLRAEMIRQAMKREAAPQISFQEKEIKTFVGTLPFTLTNAQKIAAWEILQDLEKKEPMNRLLEGDVGSGKTVVAAMSLYNTVLQSYQGVLMAPTEILSKQHFASLCELLPESVHIGLLTSSSLEVRGVAIEGSSKKKKREAFLQELVDGNIHVLVGTHALLVPDVAFHNLGFVIIDEQHRFGVAQRKMIREKSGDKNTTPHFLSMTATPIPRSFALTLYGDLDLSIINEMPPGRKPVQTRVVDPHQRARAYAFIRDQVAAGRQVFVICPLIEQKDGTVGEKKSVLSEYERLKNDVFQELTIAYLHGKMRAKEKDGVMGAFARGETDILVSTSVVEVGVNIPNASVMMIEGAERFGLAQLHQFRGRVGRSEHQSYCFLFSESESQAVAERLHFFQQTIDGFALAEYDLQLRGPGDVYGTAQSGMMQLRLATMRDVELITKARALARDIDFSTYKGLKDRVAEWEKKVHLE